MSRDFVSEEFSPSSACAEQKPSYAEKNDDGYYRISAASASRTDCSLISLKISVVFVLS
jgi:hypothetical protein